MMVKENSTGGKRQIAKLMLNSLYGKFASRVIHDKKVPYLEDDRVKYEFVVMRRAEAGVHASLACSSRRGRDKTIRPPHNHDRFLYADTDSLHLLGTTPRITLRFTVPVWVRGRSRVRLIGYFREGEAVLRGE